MLENLKKLREETGTTQKQLAEAISTSQQSVNKYENHNIEPDIRTLMLMADYFNTSIDYLVGYTDIRHKIEEVKAYELTAEEGRLVDEYRRLTKKQKQCVTMLIDSYRA